MFINIFLRCIEENTLKYQLQNLIISGTTNGNSYNVHWNARNSNNANKTSANEMLDDNRSYSSESEEKPNTANKPPPPIRRSSSISSQDANANVTNMYRKLQNIFKYIKYSITILYYFLFFFS